MEESKTLRWVFILVGGSLATMISFTIIYDMLIPDPCHYHFHEMDPVMSFFYSAEPADNGHPSPTLLNALCSFLLGVVFGFGLYKILTVKNKWKKETK